MSTGAVSYTSSYTLLFLFFIVRVWLQHCSPSCPHWFFLSCCFYHCFPSHGPCPSGFSFSLWLPPRYAAGYSVWCPPLRWPWFCQVETSNDFSRSAIGWTPGLVSCQDGETGQDPSIGFSLWYCSTLELAKKKNIAYKRTVNWWHRHKAESNLFTTFQFIHGIDIPHSFSISLADLLGLWRVLTSH